jgi:hypothetical protein
MNLAEFFEKTIKGAIALVYGSIYCLFMILTKPRTGSLRIWAHWRRDRAENIGPQTFQFVSSVLLAILIVDDSGSSDLSGSLFRYTTLGAKGSEIDLIRVTINAILIYMIVDMVALIASYTESPGRSRRVRSSFIDIFRYFISGAAILAAIPLMLWNLLFLTIPLGVPHFAEFIRANRWVLGLISIVVLFTIGSTVRGIAWLRETSAAPKLVPPKITTQAVLLIVPAVAFYLAIAAPRFYFILRPDEWLRDNLPQIVRPGNLKVSYLQCDISENATVTITALLSNSTETEFVLKLHSLGVVFAQGPMAGYYDKRYIRISEQRPIITIPPDSMDKTLQVIAGHSSLPLTFVYKPVFEFDKLSKLYEEWRETDSKVQGVDLYFFSPSCFLTYEAIFPDNETTISVPGDSADDIWMSLNASQAGQVTWVQGKPQNVSKTIEP